MTDPAQVTEPVSWWQALALMLGGGGLVKAIEATFRYLTRKREVEAEQIEAVAGNRVELEREDTQRMRIRAEVDKGAFERALESKSVEHRECREEVRGLREEVEHLRTEIAECRKDHELRDAFEQWVRENAERKPNAQEPPAPKLRQPTPPNGTDIVTFAPIPVARRDPRREP